MCDGLMYDMKVFKTNFLDLFEKLAIDPVINVRISVAKVLLRHFELQTEASKDQRIRAMYSQLLKDNSLDVVKILKKEHTIIDEVISSSSSDHNQSRNSQQEESAGESHPNDEVAPVGENILPPNFSQQDGVVLPQEAPTIVQEQSNKDVVETPAEIKPTETQEEVQEDKQPVETITETVAADAQPVQEVPEPQKQEETVTAEVKIEESAPETKPEIKEDEPKEAEPEQQAQEEPTQTVSEPSEPEVDQKPTLAEETQNTEQVAPQTQDPAEKPQGAEPSA